MPNPSVETTTKGEQVATISTHTVTSANLLIATVCQGVGAAFPNLVTGIQWDTAGTPQNFVFVGKKDDANFEAVEIWKLVNPTPGNKTCVASFTSAIDQMSWGITGILNAGVLGTPDSATGTAANPSVTVVDSVNGDLVVSNYASDLGSTGTTTPDGTQLWETEDVGADSDFSAQSQVATGANTVCSWTAIAPGAGAWALLGVAIKAAVGGAQPHYLASDEAY